MFHVKRVSPGAGHRPRRLHLWSWAVIAYPERRRASGVDLTAGVACYGPTGGPVSRWRGP